MSVALVFPGQGSQSLGMQQALAEQYEVVNATYREASEVLGYDLRATVVDGPQEELDRTEVTQPAMLTAGIAAWRCWQAEGGPAPSWFAGHSLGEYTALVAAGAMDFAEALRIVRTRGQLMQAAVPEGAGAMAALLGLDDEIAIAVCEEAAGDEVVRAVNFNSPGQVVIAGDRAAVERAVDLAKEKGARRAMLLRVSVPSHSPLMEPAADSLREHLAAAAITIPSTPVMNSVAVKPFGDADDIRTGLHRQVFNPVRWTDTVRALAGEGVDTLVECGPGKVLSGLNRRIDRGLNTAFVEDPDSLAQAVAAANAS